LKPGISDQKCTEYPSQPLIPQAILGADLEAGDGQVGAVQEGDTAQDEQQESERKTDISTTFDRHQRYS
jgi:hypothetical protein